eukprot:scaffold2910_cov390-Prasinococcus_capsulatus_cf.AAC.46
MVSRFYPESPYGGAFILSYKPSLYLFNQIALSFSDEDVKWWINYKGYSDQEIFNVLYGAGHLIEGKRAFSNGKMSVIFLGPESAVLANVRELAVLQGTRGTWGDLGMMQSCNQSTTRTQRSMQLGPPSPQIGYQVEIVLERMATVLSSPGHQNGSTI